MYSLIRPLLFRLPPERAHAWALRLLRAVPGLCFPAPQKNPVHAMGLEFPHPVGLAAGFDTGGEYLDALNKLGFSFIEIGSVTPRAQTGNPSPRLFRLPKARALINRMGFSNPGVAALVNAIRHSHYSGILGINIGKNKDTPLHAAIDDYRYCFEAVYPYASYVTLNVSSPNTPDLRQLQQGAFFLDLIVEMTQAQQRLSDKHGRWVPLVVKISPDESEDTLRSIASVILKYDIAGLIATNTTCSRQAVKSLVHGMETGGLSGQPLFSQSLHVLRLLKQEVGDKVTLIGLGGIDSPETMRAKQAAGATLVQLYTGLIYEGPGLVHRLLRQD